MIKTKKTTTEKYKEVLSILGFKGKKLKEVMELKMKKGYDDEEDIHKWIMVDMAHVMTKKLWNLHPKNPKNK